MARKAARKARTQTRRNNMPRIIGGVVIAVIVVGLLVLLNLNLDRPTSTPPTVSQGKTWGKADAAVTIDEWSDFQ